MEFTVAGSAVEVASAIAFGKTLDPPEFVEALSGHSSVWRAIFHAPKPFRDRDHVFTQIRATDVGNDAFIIATVDTEHKNFPTTDKYIRANCNSSYIIERISANSCRVKRYAFADIKSSIPVHLVDSYVKLSHENFVTDLIERFLAKREKSRVEDILKAREDMLEVSWRDTLDVYSPQEEKMIYIASSWIDECAGVSRDWYDVEGNKNSNVVMKRRSVEVKKRGARSTAGNRLGTWRKGGTKGKEDEVESSESFGNSARSAKMQSGRNSGRASGESE